MSNWLLVFHNSLYGEHGGIWSGFDRHMSWLAQSAERFGARKSLRPSMFHSGILPAFHGVFQHVREV